MKKAIKIMGYTLGGLIIVLLIAFLLIRFAFKQQTTSYLYKIKQKGYTELLRQATPFSPDSTTFHFTYRQDTLRAQAVRNFFRLDTLLTTATTTWDKTLTLAQFVARNIPHANQKIQPEKYNAIDLWKYTREVEPAFNCRLHSILLHELLLSVNIINRFVTCLPADTLDSDCHVVNIVWLPEQDKWAMIDSDQKAWISSPDGTPLSLEEMRNCYIADEPMEIHPLLEDGEKRNYDYYRQYWAKNLYYFLCWEETGYDKETSPTEGRTIALAPAGFVEPNKRKSDVQTTDAARFWAPPAPLQANNPDNKNQ